MAQAGAEPQEQTPDEEQLSAVALHPTQATPLIPHDVIEDAMQTFPEQHPEGHEVPSQTQVPTEHCCPALHSAFEPQVQTPIVHESAVTALHATQAWPPEPQVEGVDVLQEFVAQHPLGQEVASQTQAPPTQCCPVAHGELEEPQAQPPCASHLSATMALQATQVPPAGPHSESVGGEKQVLPAQHPPSQVEVHPLQTPAVQVWPVGHVPV